MIFMEENNEKNNTENTINYVWETKNYEKFNKLKGNRIINEKNIKLIDISVQENGWKPEPILVNERYEVCDGQHRLEYAKRHNLSIPYLIIKGLKPKDCIRMNSKRVNWSADDYINFYAEQGNENYQRIRQLRQIFDDIDLSTILYATTNKVNSITRFSKVDKNRKGSASLFDGELECSEDDYWKAWHKLQYLMYFLPYVKKIGGAKRYMLKEILIAYEWSEIDNERLKKVFKEGYNRVPPPINMTSADEIIEELYNYRLSKKVWFTKYCKERNLQKNKETNHNRYKEKTNVE